MPFTFENSAESIRRARPGHLPGGVSSNYRLGMAPTPLVFERADGPYLYDVDGNRLIDYYLGMGPMILGHRPQALVEAVTRQARTGHSVWGQSELDIRGRGNSSATWFPPPSGCASARRAPRSSRRALRLARAATGRSKDREVRGPLSRLARQRPVGAWRRRPTGWARRSGPHAPRREPRARMDAGGLAYRGPGRGTGVDDGGGATGAGRCGGRHHGSRHVQFRGLSSRRPAISKPCGDLCTRTGTVLVFDEVITGFRVGPGGVQKVLGVTPELSGFGKAIANGFPVAALVGRADLMDRFAAPAR